MLLLTVLVFIVVLPVVLVFMGVILPVETKARPRERAFPLTKHHRRNIAEEGDALREAGTLGFT